MKLYAYRYNGKIEFVEQGMIQYEPSLGVPVLLGTTVDFLIEKPKKTVAKEATSFFFESMNSKENQYRFYCPNGAKNIKCTYEIEE